MATFLNQCFLVWKTLVFCQERHQTLFLSPFCPKRMGEKISNLCPKLWTNLFEKCKFCDVFIVKKGYLSIYSTSPNTFKHLKRKEGKFSSLTKILDVFLVKKSYFSIKNIAQTLFSEILPKKLKVKKFQSFDQIKTMD